MRRKQQEGMTDCGRSGVHELRLVDRGSGEGTRMSIYEASSFAGSAPNSFATGNSPSLAQNGWYFATCPDSD